VTYSVLFWSAVAFVAMIILARGTRLQKNCYQCGCQGTHEATYQELAHCATFLTLVLKFSHCIEVVPVL
jgi:hypothetical protein